MNAFVIICIAAIVCSIAGLIWHAGKSRRAKKARALEQARREAAKAEKAAAKAEQRKQAKPAAPKAPKRKRGRPRKEQPATPSVAPVVVLDQTTEPPKAPKVTPATVQEQPTKRAPIKCGAFAGQSVAFTGTLEWLTRSQAIAAVQAQGGKAFDTMPAGTTLLVVGKNPGMGKLDKADRWIGQVRKITEAQFMQMMNAPKTNDRETFTLQAFAARYCA